MPLVFIARLHKYPAVEHCYHHPRLELKEFCSLCIPVQNIDANEFLTQRVSCYIDSQASLAG